MTIIKPMEKLGIRSLAPAITDLGPYVVLAAALTLVGILLVRLGPDLTGLSIAAVSGLFFVLAALVAVAAWRQPRKGPELTYWDVAGALTLIGIFVAATIEPEQMVQLVASTERQR